jgi:hypothetical protein
VGALDFFHKMGDLLLVRNVARDGYAADLSRDRLSALRVGVGHDHCLGAGTRESPRQRSADASCAARDDDDAISYFHATPPPASGLRAIIALASLSLEASLPVEA